MYACTCLKYVIFKSYDFTCSHVSQLDAETLSLIGGVVTLCQSALSLDCPNTPPDLVATLQILHGKLRCTHVRVHIPYHIHHIGSAVLPENFGGLADRPTV